MSTTTALRSFAASGIAPALRGGAMSVLGTAAAVLAFMCAPASGQDMCEEDAGSACEDDGGVDAPPPDAGSGDGGMSMTDAGSDSGTDGGGGGAGVACSCHTDSESEPGQRIHVCTESSDEDVCLGFDCERGTVRSRGCPGDEAQLCCVMRSRGLQSYLYEDCTHANCESGFREQCREFGGTVSEGACEGTDGSGGLGGDSDADGDSCAVRAPGAGAADRSVSGIAPALRGGSMSVSFALAALGLLAARLRRRAALRRSCRAAGPRPV